MNIYLVEWQVELHAESPQEAAQKAQDIQLDPDSTDNLFSVWDAK